MPKAGTSVIEFPDGLTPVNFEADLGVAAIWSNSSTPWQNEGQSYAAAQTYHVQSVFEVESERGVLNTGLLKHFFKVPTIGTRKGSEMVTEPLYPVWLGGKLELFNGGLVTLEEAMAMGLFKVSRSAR